MKRTLLFLSVALWVLGANAQEMSYTDISALTKTVTRKTASVHDPSVVHESGDTYYIFGSHRSYARSTDHMKNWSGMDNASLFGKKVNGVTQVCDFNEAFLTNEVQKVTVLVNNTPTEVDFGTYNACEWAKADDSGWFLGDAWGGNMWAPDVLYNTTMKKWCMYLSINGNDWHSVIILLTADKISGPYVYQGPVCFSGFLNDTNSYINWKKTDLELVIGTQSSLPDRYNTNKNYWGDHWPNNIDPCVFFDETGKLWMAYGSWSGGIFMLELDEKTGLRDYTVTYPSVDNGVDYSDPYFGKRIAGGYYTSGEGAYIQHIGEWYYLFMSYGFFAPGGYEKNDDGTYKLDRWGNKIPTGGYEMRTYRSKNPDGPYLDASGNNACDTKYMLNYGPTAATNKGMKLLGAYNQWGTQTVGECAQGHNSAIVDEQGRAFVIYHTKFNNGTAGHQVRTRQLFINADGWLCAAPFQFDGETETDATLAKECRFTKDEMAGTYDLIVHKYRMNFGEFEEVTPVTITLAADGKVTGALSGTWTLTQGTGHITLTLGSVTYKGVIVEQTVDGTSQKAIGITATASSGVSLWAYRLTPQTAVAITSKQYSVPVRNDMTYDKHYPLYGNGVGGTDITWTSSEPSVISNTGFYNPADTATKVTLTLRIENGTWFIEKTYTVTAAAATKPEGDYLTGLVAYYDFNAPLTYNHYNNNERAVYLCSGSGQTPTLETNPGRQDKVYHQSFAPAGSASYARCNNPLKGQQVLTGFTVSLWVQRTDENLWDALWAFTDKSGVLSSVSERLFLTGNGYVGFNNGTDWIDINRPDNDYTTKYIPVGSWHLVTVTVDAEAGICIYVDGTLKNRFASSFTCATSAGTGNSSNATAKLFDYTKILKAISTASYFQLGAGSFWGSTEALMDDLLIYNRALSAKDVAALTTMANRVTDFSKGEGGDAILTVSDTHAPIPNGIYDLTGRRLPGRTCQPGLYIIQGRKTLVK